VGGKVSCGCEHATVAVADNQFGRAVVIENCGHMVTFDDLDWFNEVLLDFLRTTPVAG
jgi:pimeloyl-ACP methyl ester carboxylesterase